jgi:1-acyl-sn-glycerol-3-phosphate acyltransferase
MSYLFFRRFFMILLKIFNRFQVIGAGNIPGTGPVILVANHISFWDPFVMGSASPRVITYLAKEVLFKIPIVGFFIKGWGAVPVKRGRTDRETFNRYLDLLKQGHTLGIYIEGTRNRKNPDQMLPPKSGPAMLALRSNAPIIPMALINTKKIIWGFRKVKAIIGPPLKLEYDPKLDKKEIYRQIGAQITAAIMKLKQSETTQNKFSGKKGR